MTSSQMDLKARALCFALRNPAVGEKKAPLKVIAERLRKKDGTKPSIGAISKAASAFAADKAKAGRKVGYRKRRHAKMPQSCAHSRNYGRLVQVWIRERSTMHFRIS